MLNMKEGARSASWDGRSTLCVWRGRLLFLFLLLLPAFNDCQQGCNVGRRLDDEGCAVCVLCLGKGVWVVCPWACGDRKVVGRRFDCRIGRSVVVLAPLNTADRGQRAASAANSVRIPPVSA